MTKTADGAAIATFHHPNGQTSQVVGPPDHFRDFLDGEAGVQDLAPAIEPAGQAVTVEVKPVLLGQIDPSPYQPRQVFDQAELLELGATIQRCGLIHPIVVRRSPTHTYRYELIAGERRMRAAEAVGLQEIEARIIDVDDATAEEMVTVENLHRKDLNAIEIARGLQAMLRRPGATQASVAERLGKSQPWVADRVGLVELPEYWQQQIITGAITATSARLLKPYKAYPKILEAIRKDFEHNKGPRPKTQTPGPDAWQPMSYEDFRDECVAFAVREVTKGLDDTPWDVKVCQQIPAMKLSPEQLAELGVIEVPARFGQGTDRLATNVKAFDKLWAAHVESWRKRKMAGEKIGTTKGTKSTKSTAEMSPAERKAAAEAEKRKRQQQAEQLGRWLQDWITNWRRYLIARAIRDDDERVDKYVLLRIVMAIETWWRVASDHDVKNRLDAAIAARAEACGRSPRKHRDRFGRSDLSTDLWEGDEDDVVPVLTEFAARAFYDAQEGPSQAVDPDGVRRLFDYLGLDLAGAWSTEQAGPLSLAYWNRHTTEQLKTLAGELKVDVDGLEKKADLVKALQQPGIVERLPQELYKAARGK